MRSLVDRLTGAGGPHRVSQGAAPTAHRLWEYVAPGATTVAVDIEPASGSVYVADGWGVTYPSIRFRRLDLATGNETAAVRTGTAMRCFIRRPDGDLLGASDSKIFRLDPLTLLERQRWETRIPRYTSSMAISGDQLVVADSVDPQVRIIDLATGKVRRREAPRLPLILSRGDQILVIGGSEEGGLIEVDARNAEVRPVVDTPPALNAWLSPFTGDLWLLPGVRVHLTATSADRGKPSTEVMRLAAPAYRDPASFRLPKPVSGLTGSASDVWLSGDRFIRGDTYLIVLALETPESPARTWKPPSGESIAAIDAPTSTVITAREVKGKDLTTLTCYRLELGPG